MRMGMTLWVNPEERACLVSRIRFASSVDHNNTKKYMLKRLETMFP